MLSAQVCAQTQPLPFQRHVGPSILFAVTDQRVWRKCERHVLSLAVLGEAPGHAGAPLGVQPAPKKNP